MQIQNNMATEVIEALIEGGKATAAPPLGPALGPLGVNIGQIIADINKKTQDFKGMQVPVKVEVDPVSKDYEISVGTPPASQLIIKEAKIEKGSSNPHVDFVADLKIEQVIKVSMMKKDALLGNTNKDRVKEVMGTCQSMGIMVEGKPVPEALKDVDAGKYDKKIESGKTELSVEELKEIEEERKRLQQEIEERRDEFLEEANKIMESMKDAELSEIKGAMTEAGIPVEIIDEVMPSEPAAAAVPGAEGEAPAEEPGEKPAEEKPE